MNRYRILAVIAAAITIGVTKAQDSIDIWNLPPLNVEQGRYTTDWDWCFFIHHIFDVKIAKNCIKRNNRSIFFTFFGQNEQSTCIVARTIMYLCNIILSVPRRRFTMIFASKREIVCTFKLANNVKSTMKKKLFRHKWVILQIKGLPLQLTTYYH